MALDDVDLRIIAATQAGLPLEARPYRAVGEVVGVPEDEVMVRLERLLATGAIRRIGVIPNHIRLGLRSNGMTVWDVDDGVVAELGGKVGALDFVTHCYRRPRHLPAWPYNLFAMVHGADRDTVEEKATTIRALLGSHCRGHEVLHTVRLLKKTGLRLPAAGQKEETCFA